MYREAGDTEGGKSVVRMWGVRKGTIGFLGLVFLVLSYNILSNLPLRIRTGAGQMRICEGIIRTYQLGMLEKNGVTSWSLALMGHINTGSRLRMR